MKLSPQVVMSLSLLVLWSLTTLVYGDYHVSVDMRGKIQQYSTQRTSVSDIVALDTSFWGQVWTPSFDSAWPSSNAGNYASGKIVPLEIAAVAYTNRSSVASGQVSQKLTAATSPVLVNQTEFDSYGGIGVILIDAIDNNVSDCIPRLFASRKDALPVTKGDIVIYNVMVSLGRDSQSFNPIPDAQLASWTAFAQAKNPVYRLIAAQTFSQFADNYSQWASFYTLFANETDPDIAKIVVTTLGNSGQKSLISTLQAIQTGQTAVGNATVAQLAATTIQNLQNTGT